MTTSTPAPAASSDSSSYEDRDEDYAEALELARLRLAVYALVVFGLRPARHHRAWCAALERTLGTPGGRLLLVAPPGSAKSTLASLLLPSWYLGRHPDRAILAVTSSDTMAAEFAGVVALTLATNEAHRAVFPEREARPAPRRGWSQDGLYLQGVGPDTKDPSYRGAGFGSSVIGSRAHLLILDDPTTQEQAQSEAEMARVRRYYDATLATRLHPEGCAIGICTRWHQEDLAAHLMAQGWPTEAWPQLASDYPGPPQARDAEGRAPLWPERFPLPWVEAERRRLGSALFELVHQANPLLLGGDVYRAAAWFRPLPDDFLTRLAPRLTRMTFVDTAFSARETADYTVAVTLGYDPADPQRRLYWTGCFRQRVAEGDLPEALAAHLLEQRPAAVGVEAPAFRQDATAGLVALLQQRLLGRLAARVLAVPVTTDKVARAHLPAARAEAGLLYVDRQAPWWPQAEAELLGFPLSPHDDVSDALAGACVLALGGMGQQATARPRAVRFG